MMKKPYSAAGVMTAMAIIVALMTGCASPGTPTGGARDETPPVMLRANPAPGSTGVTPRTIAIDFDEYVSVRDAFSNVVISPTSASVPRVSAVGKRVNVQFADTLLPNTTYTIDFASSIEDANEGNKLENFTYTFSTGPVLDTLRISGIVLQADNLEPQQQILVGVHSAEAPDTAFRTLRMERVAKTDAMGRFSIRGLKPGKYRLYALKDLNNDYRWDNPEEEIAFCDVVVSPSVSTAMTTDTIYNRTTRLMDTVVERQATVFLPNDILLSSFSTGYRPQYLKESARRDSTVIALTFNASGSPLPRVTLLGAPPSLWSDGVILERSAGNDTLTYWLRDPSLVSADTLRLAVAYDRNKAMGVWETASDTLTLVTRRPKPAKLSKSNKKKGEGEGPQPVFMEVKFPQGQLQEYNLPRMVEVLTPVDTLPVSALRLQIQKDSVWTTVSDVALSRADTLNPRLYSLSPKEWVYGGEYRIVVDSLALTDIYGHSTRPTTSTFKVRGRDEYGTLTFSITGINDTVPAFVELLNSSDQPVRRASVIHGKASFQFILAGTYYARLVEDVNGNGRFDAGDYDLQRQPEAVSYFPKRINLKKNWDQELSWNVTALPVDKQKPLAIKKNKPQTKGTQSSPEETEEEEPFDPTANPFDPNQRRKNSSQTVRR